MESEVNNFPHPVGIGCHFSKHPWILWNGHSSGGYATDQLVSIFYATGVLEFEHINGFQSSPYNENVGGNL